MNFHPKLVALDIDGTLVDAFGVMPDAVHAAVRRVVDAGVPVVLATGRWWPNTQVIFDSLELPPGYAVSSNGARVVTYPPMETVVEHLFDPERIVRQVAEIAPEARIAVEDGLTWRTSGPFPDGELTGNVVIQPIEELATCGPVSRVVLRDPGSSEEKFLEMVQRLHLHEVSYFVGWSAWVDIAPEGIDKAAGLQAVVDRLGLTAADVLAIGDGRNDVEMLQWAGRGVAMGDAPDEVKAAADHVTGNFADGGTVEELNRWF